MSQDEKNALWQAIDDLVKGRKSLSQPGDPEYHVASLTDRLYQLTVTVRDSAYCAGMREVQQGIIKALDLKHLIG